MANDPILSPEHAIARADALSGLHTLSGTPSATPIKVEEDVTPFLGERNHGKAAWRVDYPDVDLRFASAETGFKDLYRRIFSVRLLASDGQLLFIESSYQGEPDPDLRPMPPCGPATAQLSMEDEVYEGYPEDNPELTFIDALEAILNGGSGSPFLAKAIHAVYVLHSRMGSEQRAVWAVTLRGLPPLPAHGRYGDQVPVWQRNHMRNVVDANTGEVLFATNSPQPLDE